MFSYIASLNGRGHFYVIIIGNRQEMDLVSVWRYVLACMVSRQALLSNSKSITHFF